VRIGHRIAIMEGGRVVQIGTPRELLCNPVNKYVRDFFNGFDTSRILKAGDIAQQDSNVVYLPGSQVTIKAEASLRDIFHIVAASATPMPVVDEVGLYKGSISQGHLLSCLSNS